VLTILPALKTTTNQAPKVDLSHYEHFGEGVKTEKAEWE
jgi:hypothetical protein